MFKVLVLTMSLCFANSALAATWVGAPTPNISLPDQTGTVKKLSDFKGKWLVLYFYPKNHTSGCTEEAKRFKEHFAQFQKQNIQIVGVSLDSVESHKQFANDLKLPFTLLSDNKKELSKQLGVLQGFGMFSFASRETFLVDPQGVIVYHYDNVSPQIHATQILRDVAQLSAKNRQ